MLDKSESKSTATSFIAPPWWKSECTGVRPAIDEEVLAGDIARLRAAQISARIAELGRVAESPGRDGLEALGGGFLFAEAARLREAGQRLARAVGEEGTGQEVVDGDVVPHGLARHAGDEAREPGAGAVRKSERRQRRFYRGRGDVHHAAEAARNHAVH